jgi:hypothetical protein
MAKQFEAVGGRFGAPMGRQSYGTPENAEGKIRLFEVNLDSGGYDDGGAYWGRSPGRALYCATDDRDYRQFVRAASRPHAVLLLDIDPRAMAKPINTKDVRFGRFRAVATWIGADTPGYAITRFRQYAETLASWADLVEFAQRKEEEISL